MKSELETQVPIVGMIGMRGEEIAMGSLSEGIEKMLQSFIQRVRTP